MIKGTIYWSFCAGLLGFILIWCYVAASQDLAMVTSNKIDFNGDFLQQRQAWFDAYQVWLSNKLHLNWHFAIYYLIVSLLVLLDLIYQRAYNRSRFILPSIFQANSYFMLFIINGWCYLMTWLIPNNLGNLTWLHALIGWTTAYLSAINLPKRL